MFVMRWPEARGRLSAKQLNLKNKKSCNRFPIWRSREYHGQLTQLLAGGPDWKIILVQNNADLIH